ncbi:hypothetical protein BHE94_17170 [Bacillus pumilus]|uniref:Uncharacterized protein n=1 Tax=Bacillus pumilus (strain SAFR-032) TaxID=315750 RepID=A8FCC3_BACP2|nr:hypothetical protein BPUM_1206 [Bacillus pumilus SAFR-032]AVI40617.1 hypothetical protein C5Y82_06180 [Bacillus pumilus]OUZ06290.1 hypothetical protein BHE94_17170 [Bacillus pumilus]
MPGVTGIEWNKLDVCLFNEGGTTENPFFVLYIRRKRDFFVPKGIAEGINNEKAKDRHQNWQ